MAFRVVEGTVEMQGTVSGTDATTLALTDPQNIAEHVGSENVLRIWLENSDPVNIINGPFTVINTTASGGDVQILGEGTVDVTTVGDIITVGGTPANALVGSDGVTVTSGDPTDTISGFRTEFVSASGSLQTQIDAVEGSDVDSVNALIGDIVVVGKGEVGVTVEGQNIVVSGTDHTAGGGGGGDVSDAMVGTDGITVLSGTPTASETTISGFRTEFINASGTLSTQITDDIATHTADTDAHHAKYTDAEAVTALAPTTDALSASGVATDTTFTSHAADDSAHHIRYTKDENDALIGGSM